VVNVIRPGEGINVGAYAGADISKYAQSSKEMKFSDFLLHIVPSSVADAFAKGDVVQVVFFSILFGVALSAVGSAGRPVVTFLESLAHVFFRVVRIIMYVAPIGAFGAMAATIGSFGAAALLPLGKLMLSVYTTMAVFVLVALNAIAAFYRFSLWEYLKFIREEIILVLGTSSSEVALPRLMAKLERYGCSKSVVGLVVPAGYSFNLDGTSIYLSMAAIFIAQAYGIHLGIEQQLTLLLILMVTSKGAAGVTGSGFIVLASTLAATRIVPVEGVAIVLGVDRFMSEARAIVNLIGNGVAAVAISKSENAFDDEKRVESLRDIAAARAAGAV
jgi:aerobic C4-dicarboxylate transport protein